MLNLRLPDRGTPWNSRRRAGERRERRMAAITAHEGETQAEHEQNKLKRATAVAESWLQSRGQLCGLDAQEQGLFA